MTLHEIPKIPYSAFLAFELKYHEGDGDKSLLGTLRFGQAFLNHFHPEVACAELFYEEKAGKARKMILENLVDYTG